jgi:hypothetical protein
VLNGNKKTRYNNWNTCAQDLARESTEKAWSEGTNKKNAHTDCGWLLCRLESALGVWIYYWSLKDG